MCAKTVKRVQNGPLSTQTQSAHRTHINKYSFIVSKMCCSSDNNFSTLQIFTHTRVSAIFAGKSSNLCLLNPLIHILLQQTTENEKFSAKCVDPIRESRVAESMID